MHSRKACFTTECYMLNPRFVLSITEASSRGHMSDIIRGRKARIQEEQECINGPESVRHNKMSNCWKVGKVKGALEIVPN